MWGDSKLWYMIADANALSGQTLVAGQQLKIPQRVNTVLNDANSFKPYDASKLLGTTMPDLLPPAAQPCGGNGQIIVTLVAIVITVAITVTLGPEISLEFWEAMAVAAIASFGSQMVGNIIGAQDGFSFESFALSVISAGVSNKIPVFKGLEPGLGAMVKAAISNAVTQGIGVALQLQEHFDWRGVASAGLSAAVPGNGHDPFSAVGKAVVSKLVHGGKMSWKQAAADAFGNVIGASLGNSISGPSAAELQLRYDEDMSDRTMFGGLGGNSPSQTQQAAMAAGLGPVTKDVANAYAQASAAADVVMRNRSNTGREFDAIGQTSDRSLANDPTM